MNEYDHGDAFKDANLHAGRVVSLPEVLKRVTSKEQARAAIGEALVTYENLFTAFIAGVDYGRKNPKGAQ